MAEDVAHDLRTHAEIDLPRGVAVPEHMTSMEVGDTGAARVFANLVSECAGGHRAVWHADRQEHFAGFRVCGPSATQVLGHRPRDRGQQRQLDGDAGLRPADTQALGGPIDVFQTKTRNLPGAEPVAREQEEHRIVTKIARSLPRNGTNDLPDVAPR